MASHTKFKLSRTLVRPARNAGVSAEAAVMVSARTPHQRRAAQKRNRRGSESIARAVATKPRHAAAANPMESIAFDTGYLVSWTTCPFKDNVS
jgi:hypothetical protein